ncbi:MAG: hypothetical protein HGA45_08035 [Chloroflexales bacterium]|nr:hypothetical protein [Chloroflexales bacterium]
MHLVAALPVITPALRVALEPAVDALVGAITLEPGGDDVRDWYADLTPPADAKVAALLEQAARRVAPRLRERNA